VQAAQTAAKSPINAASTHGERSFRPDIEGLRAVAVLLVVLDHAGLAYLRGGYIGVDVFFVLSGFLITGLLIREIEQTGSISLLHFYARRARRLLPAGSLVLVSTVIASFTYLGPSRADRVAEDARWAALFASNIRFIQQGTDYLGAQLPPSPLQHFWSLAVEEQFYAVWPALIMVIALPLRRIPIRLKLGLVLSGIIAASLLWSIHQTRVDGTTAYFSPLTRASELGAGALLAVLAPWLVRLPRGLGGTASWVGVAGILLAALTFTSTTAFPGYAIMLPVLGTVLVIAGGSLAPGGGAEQILCRAPFQWLGRLSYSLYLWHWPVLIIAAGWAGHDLALAENLVLCLVALGLSAITYVAIEDPVRSAPVLRRHHPVVSVAIGAGLVALVFGFSTWRTNDIVEVEESGPAIAATLPQSFPTSSQVSQAVAAGSTVTDWPDQPARIANPAYSDACDVTRKDTTSSVCVHGDPGATRKLVVFGDSRATMWIPALDLIGKQQRWQVIQLTKPGCQAPDFPRYSTSLKRQYTECAEYRRFALAEIAKIRPNMVLISSAFRDVERWSDGKPTTDGVEDAWQSGLASVISQISPHTDRIVVIGDMAYPDEPGIDCLTAHPGDVSACNTSRDDAVDTEHNRRERATAEENGAGYVDTTPWFCTESTCPAVIANLTTHRDSYHVAENYVAWLTGVLGQSLGLLPVQDSPLFGQRYLYVQY
jgi:peptidoglycan/LPS O-acetylase OafA/YrhL